MSLALICSEKDLEGELGHTLLWRSGFDRHRTAAVEDARRLAAAAKPDIVVVDRELPGAVKLVVALRGDPSTKHVSIAVVARGDFDPSELELLEAGANAILRLPAGPDWDTRLMRLVQIPARRNTRLPVSLRVDATVSLEAKAVAATALNISENGLLLEARGALLQVGDDLHLELPLHDGILGVEARVVRLAGPGYFGVQLLSVDDTTRERIRAFVSSLVTS